MRVTRYAGVYSFAITGRGRLQPELTDMRFQTSGEAGWPQTLTASTTVESLATLMVSGNDVMYGKFTLPAGMIDPILGLPANPVVTFTVLGGSGSFADARGSFVSAPVGRTVTNSPDIVTLEIHASGSIFAPGYPVAGRPSLSGLFGHFASGGGWKTSITLVNYSDLNFQARTQLRFYGENGEPLQPRVTRPGGGEAIPFADGVLQVDLFRGETAVLELGGAGGTLQTGSIQVSADTDLRGHSVFGYVPTGQEATVPLQRETSNSYSVSYDNADGSSTGIAVSNALAAVVDVPVQVKDQAGLVIASSTIRIGPRGHMSFQVGERFPIAAGKRGGRIEFQTPEGGFIGVVAIRGTAAGAFTTLPVVPRTAF